MSPQSSLCDQVLNHVDSRCHRRVSRSNQRLTELVDETFSMRQDQVLDRPDELARFSNPLGSDCHHLHLKKRKCNLLSERTSPAEINTDFLSGIFQDLADANGDSPGAESCTTQYTVPNPLSRTTSVSFGDSFQNDCARASKKARISPSNSLSRCSKSFADLRDGQTANPSLHLPTNIARDHSSNCDIHSVSIDSTAANIVDQVFSDSISNIAFPCLPATVSASSCSSNNLTQTSVQAAQVLETPSSNVEGNEHDDTHNKDAYGWFVDMDEKNVLDRFQAVAEASESCRAIASSDEAKLAFASSDGNVKEPAVELDSEVQWAKAADTVDDVLGEIFF